MQLQKGRIELQNRQAVQKGRAVVANYDMQLQKYKSAQLQKIKTSNYRNDAQLWTIKEPEKTGNLKVIFAAFYKVERHRKVAE